MSISPDELAMMLATPGSYNYLCSTNAGDDHPFFSHRRLGHVIAEVRPSHREAMLRRAHLII